ncbi:MAG: hypothetical protein KGI54_13265, partial [Pseudomonadota bacterium]|nr:hypothetical protein [Pseudomonadota bacterium]
MTPKQREKSKAWVAALLSGKYEQIRGALRRGSGFCCLGVLCDISETGVWKPDVEDSFFNYEVNGCL